jgi:hypothetical protein
MSGNKVASDGLGEDSGAWKSKLVCEGVLDVSFDDRIHSLLSAIDTIIENRGNVDRIEREIIRREKTRTVNVFAVNTRQPVTADLMVEIDKTAIFARDEAHNLGFDVSGIRTARNHRACRQFDID